MSIVWILIFGFWNFWKSKKLLFILIALAFLIRIIRIDTPPTYVFDEVYHAWTAAAYASNDPAGYEWWHVSPQEGTAYEWLHPPIAKLFQALGILIFGDTALGWRFFSAVFGTLGVGMVYLLGRKLFASSKIALLAAVFFAFDPLAFVQSRIAMNDMFVTTFILLAFWLLWEGRFVLMSVALGLAISTKWSAVYAAPVVGIFMFYHCHSGPPRIFTVRFWGRCLRQLPRMTLLVIIPPLIYLLSYTQFWLQGHSWEQFIELHRQIWWYQTNLEATHDFQSPAWSWPLALRPVWYFVEYGQQTVAHIYAMGNPVSLWMGVIAVVMLLWMIIRRKVSTYRTPLLFLSAAYGIFWLPWIFSPRIMFFYHYLPALPFLYLLLSFFLVRFFSGRFVRIIIMLHIAFFLIYYPHIAAVHVPMWLDNWYYLLPSWR